VIPMYDELIKRLRVSCESCKLWDGYKCCLKGECSAQKSLQAADAIEDLDNRLNLHRQGKIRHWIPVTERLPDVGEFVLIYRDEDVVSRRRLFIDVMVTSNTTDIPYWCCNDRRVLYWMPLPEPPESEE